MEIYEAISYTNRKIKTVKSYFVGNKDIDIIFFKIDNWLIKREDFKINFDRWLSAINGSLGFFVNSVKNTSMFLSDNDN